MTRLMMLLMTCPSTMQMTEHCLYGTPARRTAPHKFIDTYVLTLSLELLLYVLTEKYTRQRSMWSKSFVQQESAPLAGSHMSQ